MLPSEPDRLQREVDQVADAGVGTLEITDVTNSLSARGNDVSTHGWGTAPWVAGVEAAVIEQEVARRRPPARPPRRPPTAPPTPTSAPAPRYPGV